MAADSSEVVKKSAARPNAVIGVPGVPNGLRKLGLDPADRHDLAPNRFPREPDADAWRHFAPRGEFTTRSVVPHATYGRNILAMAEAAVDASHQIQRTGCEAAVNAPFLQSIGRYLHKRTKESAVSQDDYVHASEVNGVLVLKIGVSELRTPEVSYAVRDALTEAARDKASQLVLDLDAVSFVGSVGMLAFLGLRRLSGLDRVVLCNVSDNIRELFLVCKLLSNDPTQVAPFEYAREVDDAVEKLRA